MRLELAFDLNKNEFCADYRGIWIAFLKHALTHSSQGKFYDRYFQGTNQKDYTFTVIFCNPQYRDDKIYLDSNSVKMIFSADDRNKTGLLFFHAFINQKNKRFPLPDGNSMVLKKITQRREQLITNSKAIFRLITGSGLVIREHNRETNKDKYYTFEDRGFYEQMKYVLGEQAKNAGFSEEAAQQIHMWPVQWKKVLARHYGCYIDISVGMIGIQAEEEILQYFYQAGVGSKHSSGFGTLELVTQELQGKGGEA